jgi:hypothetical protein
MNEEKFYALDEPTLRQFRDLQRCRNEQAFIIGTAVIEAELRTVRILQDYGPCAEREQRLGAVYYELRQAKARGVALVEAAVKNEEHLIKAALGRLGIDVDERGKLYRIEPNSGLVLILKDGAWAPLERGVKA